MDEQAIARVAQILGEAERYPWKTARYLSRKLAGEGIRITPESLDADLLQHARSDVRKVRYSYFPSRKTLDLLWGHVDVVNDASNLPDPHLESEYGEFEPCEVGDDRPWCFLSHSFRDLEPVTAVYEALRARDFGVWLAEAEVLTGMMIVKAVQNGLELCDRFVLYATRHSIGSRWVLKEGLQAVSSWRMPVTVVVDGQDEALCALFADWMEDRWDHTLEARITELVSDAPADPAATMLSDLLVAGLGEVPVAERVVVLAPSQARQADVGFRLFDEEFGEP